MLTVGLVSFTCQACGHRVTVTDEERKTSPSELADPNAGNEEQRTYACTNCEAENVVPRPYNGWPT